MKCRPQFALMMLVGLSSLRALAIGHHSPSDPIFTPPPAATTDGRCTNNNTSQVTYGERCYKWLDRARDVIGCIDQTEWQILYDKMVVPYCDAISGHFTHTCHCGCFAPETKLLAFDKEAGAEVDTSIVDIATTPERYDVLTVSPDASLDALRLTTRPVARTTKGDAGKPLIAIELVDGRKLRVTEEHGVLLSDGRMVAAGDLEASDSLVDASGAAVGIARLTTEAYEGKVYNLVTDAPVSQELSHLVVAEGLIVGDLAWQNSLARELDSIVIRQ